MRLSRYFFHTLKQAPHDTEIISHQLLERGGYLKRLGKGLYILTPLMWRVIKKLQNIVREEMDRAGAAELSMPLLHPKEVWQTTGRWHDYKSTQLLYTLQDRQSHDYCLAPTHEEIAVALSMNWITSYKQLPLTFYQIGTKFRDEIRPRFGLMRCKEFIMKDAYSFGANPEQMNQAYEAMSAAYQRIFQRCELQFVKVVAHGGKIGKSHSEEFQVVADIGEDLILTCGKWACNVETATTTIAPLPADPPKPKTRLSTPNVSNVEELSALTQEPVARILKTIVYKLVFSDRSEFVAIGIRGDREVNEVKVETYFKAIEVQLATPEEVIAATGAQVGFIGPLNLRIPFYADHSVQGMTNSVVAANENHIHYLNVNFPRDFATPLFADFLKARAGDPCPHVEGGVYSAVRGIEVGHIFNLGTLYSEKMEGFFQDEKGQTQPYWMGSYGIGIGRVAAACVEQKHDDKGIVWPLALAPFKIAITAAASHDAELVACAEQIYNELDKLGVEPLLDDRDERLGAKLKDFDLIGLPYKLIIGRQFKEKGLLEIESRQGDKELIAPQALAQWAREKLTG